jgi:hypothetical protein
MKKNKTWAALAFAVIFAFTATAVTTFTEIQTTPLSTYSGDLPICGLNYYGLVKMTNNVGTFWFTAPSGTTTVTVKDLSVHPGKYRTSVNLTRRSDGTTACASNTVSMPISGGDSVSVTVFVDTPYPTTATYQTITNRLTFQP